MQNPQQQALLAQLHDIQLPDPIGWWPLSLSVWALIFSSVMIVVAVIWYFLEQRKRNKYRRQALQKLSYIQLSDDSFNDQIGAINQLLKQVALTAYGRTTTAQLYDQAWLDFLVDSCKFVTQPEHALAILQLQYQNSDSITLTDAQTLSAQQALQIWHNYALQWIKGHHQ